MKVLFEKKLKLIAAIVAVFMLFSNFSFAILSLMSSEKLFAYQSSVTISNGDFASSTITENTNLPLSPSNWKEKNKSDNITSGVISLDPKIATGEKIQDDYKLSNMVPEYVGMQDKQVLMINAENIQSSCGYESSSITMSNGKYYVVEFMAYTQASANASAKLVGTDELENYVLTIVTNESWEKYRIFVQTNSVDSITPSLELWLGNEGGNQSTGAVFFDSVVVTEYDNQTFFAILNSQNSNYLSINLHNKYIENFVNNAGFESALSNSNWTLMENSMSSDADTINGIFEIDGINYENAKINDTIQNTNVSGNTSALLINNLTEGFVGYQSSYFTVEKNGLYKLSFLVKTNITAGSASVKLVERNPYTNQYLSNGSVNPNYIATSTYTSSEFTISSVDSSNYSNEATNNWKMYSFYIKGNYFIDTEMNIEVLLGNETTGAKGYILVDNFTLQQINTNQYNSDVSNQTEANLNKEDSSDGIKNAFFNQIIIDDVNQKYPYAPSNWTLTSKNSTIVANGVVNTDYENNAGKNSAEIPTINPINNKFVNNNVLVIGNISANNQKYTSENKSLDADSYYKLTVNVLTTDLNVAKAGIRVVEDNNVLAQILDIDTENEWSTYTILINTGYYSHSVNIELSLGENALGTGFAFFDNVSLKSIEQTVYDNDAQNAKFDLSKIDFSIIPSQSTDVQGVYTPINFTQDGQDNQAVTSGVIDTSKYNQEGGYNESNLENPNHPEGENSNVLMIKSNNDVYHSYTSTVAYSLISDSYYQIDVKVKTENLSQDEENTQYDNNTAYPFGAIINIDGIDASFSGIDTNGEWKTYIMYINCTTTSTVYLQLGLGSKNAKTKGTVYFSSATITQIDEDAYADGIKVLDGNNEIDNILAVGNTDIKNNDTSNDNNENQISFDWLLIPSLVFGVAILFAVVMVIVRHTTKGARKKAKAQKPAVDGIKKLANEHKIALNEIAKARKETIQKQNQIAENINALKLDNDDKTNAGIKKLQNQYDELSNKLEVLKQKKADEIKSYKQKVEELKAIKMSNKLRK